MAANRGYTDEQHEKFLQSLEENTKPIEQNPNQIELNTQAPINVQDSSNPIAELPRKNKRSTHPPLSPLKRRAPLPPRRPPKKATIVGSESSSSSPATESLLFTFKLRSPGIFRDAIQALSDVDLNPDKLAMIEVDDTGFKIIVQNDSTKVMGIIHLKIKLLSEFQCAKRFQKLCSGILDSILILFQSTVMVRHEDVLTVSSTEFEKNVKLSFQFVGDLQGKTFVEIVEVVRGYERFQTGIMSGVDYGARITNNPLKEIIPLLLQKRIVTIKITDKDVTISVDKDFSRTLEPVQAVRTGVPERKTLHSEFEFPHGNSLRKACSLSEFFTVGIQDLPDNRVLLHFSIENLGGLHYIKPCVNVLYQS